jgi:hypothetical protein
VPREEQITNNCSAGTQMLCAARVSRYRYSPTFLASGDRMTGAPVSTVTGLAFSDASNLDLGYAGLWLGNVAEPFPEGEAPVSLRRDLFLAAAKDEVLPTTVTVAHGAPFLIGSLLDGDGISVPSGVVVTVTKPDGTSLPAVNTWTDNLVVHYDTSGNLAGFLIHEPELGTWSFTTTCQDADEPDFQLFVATLPTRDDQTDITQTLESAFGDRFTGDQINALVDRHGLTSWGCFWCEVGVWSLAVIIVVAVSVGLAYLTVQSGAVVALAAWAGVSATVALTFIKTLVALVVMGVNAVVTRICQWSGAC